MPHLTFQFAANGCDNMGRKPVVHMPFQRRVLIVEDDEFVGSLMAGALENEGFQTVLAISSVDATSAELDAPSMGTPFTIA